MMSLRTLSFVIPAAALVALLVVLPSTSLAQTTGTQTQGTAAADLPKQQAPAEEGFAPLFPKDGIPEGWLVRRWDDISESPEEDVHWKVKDGMLHGSEPRGTWLISEREYGDFELRFDFKLGARGNSGLALRAPLDGDPAFDGMELQMADLRYNPEAKDSELTGGIYRAIAPRKQVFKPEEWNSYEVTLAGNHLKVVLNGEVIHDLNLDEQDQDVLRHDGTVAPPVKDRPRQGHIGFQELSRDGAHVLIRNVRIKVIKADAEDAK